MTEISYGDQRLEARFWRMVGIDDAGCWLWLGALDSHGYGKLGRKRGEYWPAHRYAWFHLIGPTDLPLDHLCRVTRCVNPAHLEPVTHRINLMRGVAPNTERHLSNTCKAGHDLTNAYAKPNGSRSCRECAARRAREARALLPPKPHMPPAPDCPNGHVYAEVGVYLYKGKRLCMECRREADRRRR